MANKVFKFDPIPHVYTLNDVPMENITSVTGSFMPLEFFDDYDRDKGTDVHHAIKRICEGDEAKVKFASCGYINAWHRFVTAHNFATVLCEHPLYHPTELWAGTLDQFGLMDNRESAIVEIKTGPDHPSYHLQTAAQVDLLKVNKIGCPKLRIGLQLFEDGTYKVHRHTGLTDLGIFKAQLNVMRWMKRNNIK